jgi:predicted ATPase/signal transduction histidine kinase
MSPKAVTTSHSLLKIAGYDTLAQLYLGSRTVVYQAVQTGTQRSVVIKVLRCEYPSFGELVQFRNQYTITKHLPSSGIVHPLNLEPLGSGYALVMEDWGGVSLGKYIQQQSLGLTDVLTIALQLADILQDLSQHQVVHKDIKPANILIHPQSKQVKLIDFSIASLLSRETQEIQNPSALEGTLAYLAPEQTGRMNRGIDYRADFYALGVTLYQLLSERLPFTSDDPLELVHCHIAKRPVPVDQINPSIPKMVAAIVTKLMAKNAEDRYQSAIGLKHDLQQCLTQWKETGEILAFELGRQDLSDRFLIPEKLYGREAEVQTLLDAFDRVAQGSSELMLVAGFSGIGKTAIVNEVHKPITRQNGYFIKGKFDQFNRNIPLSAFVQALRDLMGQLLSESDTQLQTWKTQILAALGDNGQVMIEVIPELERIIGAQPPATELSGTAAQNRFNLLFQKFIQVFTTPEHPLVMFLDDLQWADSASLNLIQVLMAESTTGYLLLIGAYRDNEVFAAHPLMLTLDTLRKAKTTVNTIALQPLNQNSLNQLIADTLHCAAQLAQPLTELVMQKTQGNPFFATQFLKTLHQERLVTFDAGAGYWQCDIVRVRDAALTDDVVEFMALQLQKLPEATQAVLKLAACIGAQFDLQTLAIVSAQSQPEVATALWKALQEGLILPQSEVYKFYLGDVADQRSNLSQNFNYKFLHDRVQQAAYSLIPLVYRQSVHLQIGRSLYQAINTTGREERIFEIVQQMNRGLEQVLDPGERLELAQLNLLAGQKAKSATAYATAAEYLTIGIELLPPSHWQTHYDLALDLHISAVEVSYLRTHFEQMERLAEVVLAQTTHLLDSVKVYEVKIQGYMMQQHFQKALATGLFILESLGVSFPSTPQPSDAQQLQSEIQLNMAGRSIPDLLNLPIMTNPEKLAAIGLLSKLTPVAHQSAPHLFPLAVLQMVNLSTKYGNAPASTFAYATFGAAQLIMASDIEACYACGQLALRLLETIDAKHYQSRTLFVFNFFIRHWKEHAQKSLPSCQEAYQVGLDTGDLEHALYSACVYVMHAFMTGYNLTDLDLEMAKYDEVMRQLSGQAFRQWLEIHHQAVRNLTSSAPVQEGSPSQLCGDIYDEAIELPKLLEANAVIVLYYLYFNKLILAYLLESPDQACIYAQQAQSFLDAATGMLSFPVFHFYDSLSHLALYSTAHPSKQEEIASRIDGNQTQMQRWAASAPMNFEHKFALVEAERCRVLGQQHEAIDLYDRAIAGAKANEYIQEEALANELAAKFYLDWGKEKVAAGYMQEAYYCYARWGAKAKIDDLETRYPQLLHPILQAAAQPLNVFETLASMAAPNLSIHSSTQPSRSSTTSVNTALDFAAILKVSQSLAGTIQLDELLHQLTQIILQNSGGDRCALILPNLDQEWSVAAIATPTAAELCTELLEGNEKLPVKLIQYVKNTQETIIIDDSKTELPVIAQYLSQHSPKSVLCLPLLNQAQLLGILYVENRATSGVFTSDRLLVLNFLCTQAAISLENARLYQQAQTYAQQLEQSQLQTVQSEKMASLGNLVAGVAHEINNPIGFLNGSINNGKDYVQDLLGHLALYQQHYPNPVGPIQDHAEDIALEFLREDLPKLLDSMKGATDRIKGISSSLRTFSRADTEHKVSANLHEGIDSTLLILKYRLKGNEHRPEIQVLQQYGELPSIQCFPGQLNQVFMNILANAIDMFDELAQQSTIADLQAKPQILTIQTAMVEANAIEIRIRDNGKGMTEGVKARIFDHLFTTKGVGKGTGLGLAIARQIVVEKHGGSLEVLSKLGQGTEFLIALSVQG